MNRRTFLATLAALSISGKLRAEELPPIRQITRGPKFHWFGYYDKLQFDPTNRFILGNEVDFEHRSPRHEDVIRVGMVDTTDGDRWIELGTTHAWNWQQGCMLQWLPGSKNEVLWNDRSDGKFVCRIVNTETKAERQLDSPIYCVSPDGTWGVTCDFARLNDCRPGYGYAGLPDPNADDTAPRDAGLWKVDLKTGERKLLFSFADASRIPHEPGFSLGAKHWFNHLLIAPDGKRFIFLHRWRGQKEGRSFATRMFTMNADGGDPYVLDPHGKTSHFIWRDPTHVLAWAFHPSHGERFYLYHDQTADVEVVGKDAMTVNGHCTYLPGKRWILNDTYPDAARLQHPYLYHEASGRRVPLGHFASPPQYAGEWRCDTHPRFSPDGRWVCIDSPHASLEKGGGRQMYLIDLRGITESGT